MNESQTPASWWPLSLGATALMCLLGWAQAVSLAWPFEGMFKGVSLGWLQCLALAGLAFFLDRSRNTKQAFFMGWMFSLAWIAGSTWWLFIAMNTYGGLAAPLAGVAVALLAGLLALFYGCACGVFHMLCKTGVSLLPRATAFAALWTLAELVRGTLFTGFPWGAVGYAHVDSLLQHWVPWVGVYGLCGLTAWIAMVVAARRQRNMPTTRLGMVTLCVFMGGLAYTWLTSPSRGDNFIHTTGTPLRVTLLQGNIPQDMKFGEGINQALRDYRGALLTSTSDLTVTPETAIPVIKQQMPEGYWSALETHFSKGQQAALIGLPATMRAQQGQLQYSNSAIALVPHNTSTTTPSYQYDKHHLVPFGEFVPPLFQWFVRMMHIPMGDFTRGELAQPSLAFKGERIAPNICYEDLFGEELARSFRDPDQAPTIMVNISNIAWFGDTVAIDQHLNISRMRALELGRPMLRATNTGATAIITAQGQVSHRLPSGIQGALTADVQGVHGPVTPYGRWASQWGLWPVAGLALLALLLVAVIADASRHGPRRFGS